MYNGGQLRDAYNREVIPDRMQPGGASSQHQYNPQQQQQYNPQQQQQQYAPQQQAPAFNNTCSGPAAFDSGLGLGGVNSFGTVASYSAMGLGDAPVYNMASTAQATAPACGPCSGKMHYADPYGQHNAPIAQQQQSPSSYIGHQPYNQQNTGGQCGGGGQYATSSIAQQSQMQQLIQQTTPSSYVEVLHELNNANSGNQQNNTANNTANNTCTGTAESFVGYDDNNNPNGQTDQVDNRSNHLTATHESVNETLVSYLKATIKYVAQQLKSKPDWIDLSPDGGASWKYSTMVQGNSIWSRVYTRVELVGERKAYKYPLPYIGNITTTTRIKLDCELLPELLKEFPMVSYCQATKNLQITMDSLEHNLAMLALICACQKEKISINRIKYHELVKKYMLLTTPGHKNYQAGAKYTLIKQIRS